MLLLHIQANPELLQLVKRLQRYVLLLMSRAQRQVIPLSK